MKRYKVAIREGAFKLVRGDSEQRALDLTSDTRLLDHRKPASYSTQLTGLPTQEVTK